MRSVTYAMGVSLDGYIVGPDGGFDWTAPDEEVFRFWIDEIREVGVHLMGRRLYETMLYWETADEDPSLDDAELEWAALSSPPLDPRRMHGGCRAAIMRDLEIRTDDGHRPVGGVHVAADAGRGEGGPAD